MNPKKRLLLSGNSAAALSAKFARVEAVPTFPITPVTPVSEDIAGFVERGELAAKIIYAESEHSVMASCFGTSLRGKRTFTATSSQGFLLMIEVLCWVAGSRLPVVMAVANRTVGSPWAIWAEWETMLGKDIGWNQFYCKDAQEVFDTGLLSFKLEPLMIPTMYCYDGFLVSHTYEPVIIPAQEEVDRFLPPYRPAIKLDPNKPLTFGPIVMIPDYYAQLRYNLHQDMNKVFEATEEAAGEFETIFGRKVTAIMDSYNTKTARTIFVTMGSMADTVKEVATKNPDIGWIRIKMFRPFPKQKLQNVLTDRIWDDFPLEKIVVLDRSLSAGQGGHLWQEIQSSLYDVNWRCNPYCQQPKIPGYIIGLNGDDVTPELIEDIHKHSVAASNGCYMREEGVGAWKKIK